MIEIDNSGVFMARFHNGGQVSHSFSDKIDYMKAGALLCFFHNNDERIFFKCDGKKYMKEIDKTCETVKDVKRYINERT